jgi:hypothetical protein
MKMMAMPRLQWSQRETLPQLELLFRIIFLSGLAGVKRAVLIASPGGTSDLNHSKLPGNIAGVACGAARGLKTTE